MRAQEPQSGSELDSAETRVTARCRGLAPDGAHDRAAAIETRGSTHALAADARGEPLRMSAQRARHSILLPSFWPKRFALLIPEASHRFFPVQYPVPGQAQGPIVRVPEEDWMRWKRRQNRGYPEELSCRLPERIALLLSGADLLRMTGRKIWSALRRRRLLPADSEPTGVRRGKRSRALVQIPCAQIRGRETDLARPAGVPGRNRACWVWKRGRRRPVRARDWLLRAGGANQRGVR